MGFLGRSSERDEARAANFAAWLARQHPLALPSLLLSAFSLTHLGTLWVDEILGIVLGAVTLAQIRRARDVRPDDDSTDADAPPRIEGRWLAWGGVVVGVVSLLLAAMIYFALPRPG